MDPDLPALDAGPGVPAFFVVVFVLIALVGVAVVVGGLRSALRARARSADAARLGTAGVTTTGTVVDNRITSHHEHRMTFSPIVRFDAGGREVVVVGEQVWNRSFVTGRAAQVVYDPAAPDRAHVRAEGGSVVGHGVTGVVVAVFGVVFLVVVAVMARLALSVF
ncbi:DUF3592 domain-containing protein [Kineococcus rhizosphaerae]|uniref:DUF3592 domain-containing protein n=1 Tax=Kineococcus rhizosphaerae TaxID=559628 RepID=UPI00147596F9|nr:DUF3592 domain-containing protein [Kineococcus rhizosphaerae]